MAKTHRYTAQQVIEALQATHGMVYLAAQQLKCNPQTVMNYCKKFPSVEQAKHDARGAILDEAELRLLAAIRRDEAWAIAFYLKTVGRSRGYGERLDLNVSIQAVAAKVAAEMGLTAQEVLREAQSYSRRSIMANDPRLLSVELLTLAAFRLRERRQSQPPDWRSSVGLSALLAAARALPQREPWDLPDLEPRDGLAGLLAEARSWDQEAAMVLDPRWRVPTSSSLAAKRAKHREDTRLIGW